MAGVGEHSGYRGDPWGRLQRTSEFIAMTTFGPVESAQRVIDHRGETYGYQKLLLATGGRVRTLPSPEHS